MRGRLGSQPQKKSSQGEETPAHASQRQRMTGKLMHNRTLSMAAAHRLYDRTGMLLKFAIGTVPAEHEAAIAEEEKACGSFLRIPSDEVQCEGMQARSLKPGVAQRCQRSS